MSSAASRAKASKTSTGVSRDACAPSTCQSYTAAPPSRVPRVTSAASVGLLVRQASCAARRPLPVGARLRDALAVRGRRVLLHGVHELRVGEAQVVDEQLVVRAGARDLCDLALVGQDVLPHELELVAHLAREGLALRLFDALDLRGDTLEVRHHDLAGLRELLNLLRGLGLMRGEESQVLFDGLLGGVEPVCDEDPMLFDGVLRAVELAAHLHHDLRVLVADLLQGGEALLGLDQSRVVASALVFQSAKAVFRRATSGRHVEVIWRPVRI